MRLIYVLLGIFLWIEMGGFWGIASQIERDVDYFIDCLIREKMGISVVRSSS